MDFSKFDTRKRAEEGAWLDLVDPDTREPLMSGGKPCRVLVRGSTSPTIQAEQRKRRVEAFRAERAVKKPAEGKGKTPADAVAEEEAAARGLEDVHRDIVAAMAPYIVGFENVERNGAPATAEDAEWFLDLTFPELETRIGDDGKASYEPSNATFARQIGDFVTKAENFRGND